MGIVFSLLTSYWKHILLLSIVSALCYTGYNYVYDRGFEKANIECASRMKDYTDKLSNRIKDLEIASREASVEEKARSDLLKQDLTKLLVLTKNKPLTIIKEGKCLPTETFIDTYNAAILRVNSR